MVVLYFPGMSSKKGASGPEKEGGVGSLTQRCISWTVCFEFEWRLYAQSASKAIFKARTYNGITYSVR